MFRLRGALPLMEDTLQMRKNEAVFEGGYAFFQIGLTLYGWRSLMLQRRDDLDVEIPMFPGHIYIGNLCPARHRYRHPHVPDDIREGLLSVKHLGQVQLVILLQSRIFRHCAAASPEKAPNPGAVWERVSAAVNKAILTLPWQLPSLNACMLVTGDADSVLAQ